MFRAIRARAFATTIPQKGNFELSYDIPSRYFMLTYQMLPTKLADLQLAPEYEEHRANVKN